MNFINLNGKITSANNANLPIANRAFRYGYGLFETLLIKNNTLQLKQYHWDRLLAGLQQLCLQLPMHLTTHLLEAEILKTVQKNQLQHCCRVRLQLYAQEGGLFDYQNNQAGYLIECFALNQDTLQLNINGLVVGLAQRLQKSNDSLSNIKSCNALIYAIAAQQAKQNQWNDALISNTKGNIIESTIANIFWIKDNVVYTPPLSEGCVAGVMRSNIINHCGNIVEQPLTKEILFNADELFLTNAIKGIRWVANFEGKEYSNTVIKNNFQFVYK